MNSIGSVYITVQGRSSIGLTKQMKRAARHKASLPKILGFIYRLFLPRSYRPFGSDKEAYQSVAKKRDADGRGDGR